MVKRTTVASEGSSPQGRVQPEARVHALLQDASRQLQAIDEVAAPAAMVNFEDENGADSANALLEACRTLQGYKWYEPNLLFYFGQVEIKMASVGVKKQFTKFQVLSSILPPHVIEEVMNLLKKQETDFVDNNAYKLLKTRILKIFGPNAEDPIERALSRV